MEHTLEFVQNNLMYVMLAVTSGAMLIWQTFSIGGGNQVSPLQATLMLNREDAMMIDVREASEWSARGYRSDLRLLIHAARRLNHRPRSGDSRELGELGSERLTGSNGGTE